MYLHYSIAPTTTEALIIFVGRTFMFPVNRSPYPVLSAMVSQLFPLHASLQACGRQDFASAMETAGKFWRDQFR